MTTNLNRAANDGLPGLQEAPSSSFLARRSKSNRQFIYAAGLLFLLAGCSFAPKYEQPAAPVPAAIGADAGTIGAGADPTQTGEQPLRLQAWRDVFVDPQRQSLIEAGLEHNRDLREAALNVEAARAHIESSDLPYCPTSAFMRKGRVSACRPISRQPARARQWGSMA